MVVLKKSEKEKRTCFVLQNLPCYKVENTSYNCLAGKNKNKEETNNLNASNVTYSNTFR